MDEMWSYVHDKSQQVWLWWAIDHNTGEPLAFVLGPRTQETLDDLCNLMDSHFSVDTMYTDACQLYDRITGSWVITSKRYTQRIENKHLSLRTWRGRLVRKGIRFSKSILLHKIVVGIIINFWFFHHKIW
jgi:insertion element IS1 protein InsB